MRAADSPMTEAPRCWAMSPAVVEVEGAGMVGGVGVGWLAGACLCAWAFVAWAVQCPPPEVYSAFI